MNRLNKVLTITLLSTLTGCAHLPTKPTITPPSPVLIEVYHKDGSKETRTGNVADFKSTRDCVWAEYVQNDKIQFSNKGEEI